MAESTVRITQRRSANGTTPSQRETLRTLGLRGIGSTSERSESQHVRGMLKVVAHLVEVSEVGGKRPEARGQGSKARGQGSKARGQGSDG